MGVDVVHVHTPSTALSLLPILPKVAAKTVYISRGGLSEGSNWLIGAAWKAVDPMRWRSWDAVGVINSSQQVGLGSRRSRNASAALIPIGGVGVSRESVDRAKDAIVVPKPARRGRSVSLVWVGRFDKGKRPADFIELIRRLRSQNMRVEGTMVGGVTVGDRPQRGFDMEHAIDLGIEVTGWVNDPLPYMRRADFLIHTSAREGYGMTPIEAALVGTPTIAYATSGTMESVPAVYGWLAGAGNLDQMTDLCRRAMASDYVVWSDRVMEAAWSLSDVDVWKAYLSLYDIAFSR